MKPNDGLEMSRDRGGLKTREVWQRDAGVHSQAQSLACEREHLDLSLPLVGLHCTVRPGASSEFEKHDVCNWDTRLAGSGSSN